MIHLKTLTLVGEKSVVVGMISVLVVLLRIGQQRYNQYRHTRDLVSLLLFTLLAFQIDERLSL